MRSFQQIACAQVVCDGHGFMRNLRDGFIDWASRPATRASDKLHV